MWPKSDKKRCLFLDRFCALLLHDFGINFGAFFDHFLIKYGEKCQTGAYVIFDECFERFACFYGVRGLKMDQKCVQNTS